MATESELKKWIERANNTYDRYIKTIDNCNDQIARLQPVYDDLTQIKKDFRTFQKDTAKIIEDQRFWTGEQFNLFCQKGESLDDACRQYYLLLDQAHDAVNTKIGDLKAEKDRLVPLLGGLLGDIDKWWAELKNFTN